MTTIRVAQRERYTVIDRRTLNDERLSFRARGVLAWLLDKPDDWTCNADDIATAGTEGRDAVRTALRELVGTGYIARERRQAEGGLWVTDTVVYERPPTDDGKPGVGEPATDDGKPGVGFSGANPQALILKTENTQNTCSASPSVAVLDATFEAFWREYPRKVGKGNARKAWKQAMKVGTIDAIMEGVKRYASERAGSATTYIAHPTSWLNGQRWLDEPGANVTNTGRPSRAPKIDTDRERPGGVIDLWEEADGG
jgi:hypothetical protein